ncbi:tyrosine-type recombinase/integrase [Nostoc sp.]|uniref:tyrosine-type recombinase/integrase n=1 Tax=Nostoc sp. TaxID=1180 RepID=UPI002FFCF76C
MKLQFQDCYDSEGKPREYINFCAASRKASPNGERKTRQVPVHPVLLSSLLSYKPEHQSIWLFPNRENRLPIEMRCADKILRAAVAKAGLVAMGISTHSTRRTFITKLHHNGTDLYTIKQITGHQDFKSLERYVEIDSDRVRGAINAL